MFPLAWTLDESYSNSFAGAEEVNALTAAFSVPYWNWGCVVSVKRFVQFWKV